MLELFELPQIDQSGRVEGQRPLSLVPIPSLRLSEVALVTWTDTAAGEVDSASPVSSSKCSSSLTEWGSLKQRRQQAADLSL